MSYFDKSVQILKAARIGKEPVPSLRVEIFKEIGDVGSLEDHRRLHTEQAAGLADALICSLPGGTVDALLTELMRRRASLFSVPFESGRTP